MPNWKPQKKLSNNIKWGYKIDPQDPERLIPIPEMEKLMDQAFKFLKSGQYSQRDVAAWISEASGKKLSHVALRNHYVNEKRRIWRNKTRDYTAKQAALEKAAKQTTINVRAEETEAGTEGGQSQQDLAC